MNNWFEVDKEGLKALQAGKPKTFIISELVQNMLDQNVKICSINVSYTALLKIVKVVAEDDDPEGFNDLRHAYTMFLDTYKRKDPTKRGRFVIGEKQVISVCESAIIETTKGTVIFNPDGTRTETPEKRSFGSKVTIEFEGTEKDVDELLAHTRKLIVPHNITFIVNGEIIKSKPVCKSFEAILDTEILKNDVMVMTARKTKVDLYESKEPWIYEMGIPVMKTDCPWSIDVQQKIPLAVDRETIKPAYIQDLYAEVVNNTYNELTPEQTSEVWVRTGMKDQDCKKEAIKVILTKRFGEKFCVGNTFDKASMDEALSRGYNVIFGSEMSADEWERVRELGMVESSTALFGNTNLEAAQRVEPSQEQKRVGEYAKRIAKRILKIDIKVHFVSNPKAPMLACYGNRTLTFNVGRLNNGFFDKTVSKVTTDLIIHELGHENGWHVEYDYHQLLTRLGAELTMLALTEPEFFKVN